MNLIPINDHVLVELGAHYTHAATPEKKYDTPTNGIVVRVDEDLDEFEHLIGKRVYWETFSERITHNNKIYAFIKFDDLRGYESVQA